MTLTKVQKENVIEYLKASTSVESAEKEIEEFVPMTNVFETIKNLNKCFSEKEVSYIIINRNELATSLL